MRTIVASWGLALLALTGCMGPGVRLVEHDGKGGVVSLPSNSDVWPTHYRSKALQLMEEQCPQGYEVVHEGEVVLGGGQEQGQTATERYEYNGALERLSDYEQREYRITFRCRPAPPPG